MKTQEMTIKGAGNIIENLRPATFVIKPHPVSSVLFLNEGRSN